jgi:hypothetical protein
VAISIFSGLLLSLLFVFFEKFPNANIIVVSVICVAGFYLISILVRAQNQRGRALTGKAGIKENYIKYIFPVLGFALGFAFLFL